MGKGIVSMQAETANSLDIHSPYIPFSSEIPQSFKLSMDSGSISQSPFALNMMHDQVWAVRWEEVMLLKKKKKGEGPLPPCLSSGWENVTVR